MSLRWRLALALGGISFCAIAVVAGVSYVSTSRELYASVDRFLRDRAALVAESLRGEGPRLRPPRPGSGVDNPYEQADAVVQVVDAAGRVRLVGVVELPVDADAVEAVAGGGRTATYDTDVGGVPYRVRVQGGRFGAIQVARDLTETRDVLRGLRDRSFAIAGIGTVLAAAVGALVAHRTTRPVERLSAAAEHVAATQDLATPVPVEGHAEVGRLARSFNAMLGALAASKEQQRRLVEDASHELRTPLTSLRTNIELLRTVEDLPPADRRALLDDLGTEMVELTDLVGELVELARDPVLDAGEPEAVRLDELVQGAVARAARRSGRAITVDAEPAVVLARPPALERALANLLGNAAKFSPGHTVIEVRQRAGRVEVRDHGPGIPPADRPHVFERFYRAETTRSAPGSGLGLAIVAQVVADAGGTVFAGAAEDGGAVVGFELPPGT